MSLIRNVGRTILRTLLMLPCALLRHKYFELDEVLKRESPRILLVACHWIGDTLWAVQVVPELRKQWPNAHISAITKPITQPLWSGPLAVDSLVDGSAVISDRQREPVRWGALRTLGRELAQDSWDLVVDLTGNRYSALFCHWIHAGHTLGFGGDEFNSLYATHIMEAERDSRHLAERPFRIVAPLIGGFNFPGKVQPPISAQSYHHVCAEHHLDPNQPLAIIAPGAGWPGKEWNEAVFAETACAMTDKGCQVVILDAPANCIRAERLAQAATRTGAAAVPVTAATLGPATSLLSACSLFVGNDSGLAHLAAAYGRKTLCLFRNATDPAHCAPVGPDVTIIREGESVTSVVSKVIGNLNCGGG